MKGINNPGSSRPATATSSQIFPDAGEGKESTTSRLTVPPGHRTVLTDRIGNTTYTLIPSRLVVTGDAYKEASCDS